MMSGCFLGRAAISIVASMAIATVLAGCGATTLAAGTEELVRGGDASKGKQAIAASGCGYCHMIPGITGAHALVGPPLIYWSGREVIAGCLANTPDNLSRWIERPQAVEKGTAMPDLGVGATTARDIAAYLFTIK
jgi:cytochrome c2